MSIYKISDSEGELLNIIEAVSPLEWRRYNQRYPQIRINNRLEKKDCSDIPPFVAFRFENESEEIINKLKFLINNYRGFIKWELHKHKREPLQGTNWVIRPLRVREVTALAEKNGLVSEEYLAKYEPEFGPIAFDDLNALTQYIADNLK
ncbi:hypothetical protein [Gilliamella sp. Choc5-1]|uniref:hypothetical protein n=1 Tax=Gilliamella sp. Choc5-1 TaxID=3120238 RepID=UPI00114752CE|nr:hypothetical protein [Gilliamella apicola]